MFFCPCFRDNSFDEDCFICGGKVSITHDVLEYFGVSSWEKLNEIYEEDRRVNILTDICKGIVTIEDDTLSKYELTSWDELFDVCTEDGRVKLTQLIEAYRSSLLDRRIQLIQQEAAKAKESQSRKVKKNTPSNPIKKPYSKPTKPQPKKITKPTPIPYCHDNRCQKKDCHRCFPHFDCVVHESCASDRSILQCF